MTLLLASQVLVSMTLLVSGLAKLPDRTATADAMISLRLPVRSVHLTTATVLPIAEIALALAVWIPVPTLQAGLAALTLILMLAYLAIIGRALTFSEEVTCSCFGTLGSPTVSRITLGRNALLVVLAALALASAVTGTTARALRAETPSTLTLILSLVLAAALTALTIGGSRRRAGEDTADPSPDAADAAAPLPAGDVASDLPDDAGTVDALLDYERVSTPFGMLRMAGQEPTTLRTLTRERAALLIWVQPGCGPCERVLSAVPDWTEEIGDVVTIRTLFRVPPEELPASVLERTGGTAAWDIDRNLMDVFRARHSPSAVLLGADGQLAGGPVRGGNDVIRFVQDIVDQLTQARATGGLPTA